MIDEFDYLEPTCPLCGGSDFYDPKPDSPLGRIPVDRVIDRVDSLLDKNNYPEAGRLLEYWKAEAVSLKDLRGELAIENELVGFYRKQGNAPKGLSSVGRALELVNALNQSDLPAGATVILNCATAYKAFGRAEEAMPLYTHAEAVYKSSLEPNDARFGGLYNNMALALCDLKRFEEAEAAYFTALEVMANVPGGQAECAITKINLAHMYEAWGKTERIPGCLADAIDLLESPELTHNGYYAFVLEKCAPSFGYFGFAEACEYYKKESEEIYARA